HARRTDATLVSHLAACGSGILPSRKHRRPRRRLAHCLRRHRTVLRPRRSADRHLRQSRGIAQRPGRHLPAASPPTLLRAADQGRVRPAGYHVHPGEALDPDTAARQSRAVSLLRPVRPRVHDQLKLLESGSADPSRTQNGQSHALPVATGVSYIDKATGEDRHVRARVVVLAASACESARLLLNSKSSLFPDGLANGSGMVGKYLTDTTGAGVQGFIPKMMERPPHNEDGSGSGHIYMPWWLDNRSLDFPRGYHIEVGGGFDMPGYGVLNGIERYPAGGGWGRQLKDDYRRYYGAMVGFAGRGEMVPSEKCYCEIDPDVVDRWGIPVLR